MRPAWPGLSLHGGRNNPIVCGRKLCTVCGRWRPVSDFPLWRCPDGARLAPRCDACVRAYLRRRYHRETPEQRKLRREYGRIWREAKRRERGVPVRPWGGRKRSVVDRPERILIPAAPLVKLLEPYRDTEKLGELARRAGVPDRSIGRLLSGESARVRIDLADKLAVALGVPSAVIWKELW